MRIPFPYPLAVGSDITFLPRIWCPDRSTQEGFTRLARRILQTPEFADLNARYPAWKDLAAQETAVQHHCRSWLGGRWAAKEAAKKAWGASLLGFKDLRVMVEPEDGSVSMVCALEVAEDGMSWEGVEQVARLSISHDEHFAFATVLASPLDGRIVKELERRKALAEARVGGQTV